LIADLDSLHEWRTSDLLSQNYRRRPKFFVAPNRAAKSTVGPIQDLISIIGRPDSVYFL